MTVRGSTEPETAGEGLTRRDEFRRVDFCLSISSNAHSAPRPLGDRLRHSFLSASCWASCALLFGCDLTEKAGELVWNEPAPDVAAPGPASAESGGEGASPNATAAKAGGGAQGVIQPVPPVTPPSGAVTSFADLVSRSNSAVVFVRTIQSRRQGFHRVLQDGSGSGFVFDPDGKILTNHHVVAGAHAIAVEFSDDTTLMAQVIGADPLTDLAVLEVPARKLAALPLGDSDQIRVGDWVVAIGNPFGLEHTVSAGIISAKERTSRDVNLGDPHAYYSFLQTDASINPGNSGGPLLDLSGRVVGINTAINQGANNIGFAIPVNMILELLPQLLEKGRVDRAAIGVRVDDVSAEDQERFQLADRNGALVVEVIRGGPAARAKVLTGDVVVELDGRVVRSPEQLRFRASLCPIGEDVPLVVMRGGQRLSLVVQPAPLSLR